MDSKTLSLYKLRADFIVYCHIFQQFDMYKKRELEEIKGIIEAIPHNRGFARNDIKFEGTFDYLEENMNFIELKVSSLKKTSSNDKFTLGEFIQYALPQ